MGPLHRQVTAGATRSASHLRLIDQLITVGAKGRRQNTSVETGDFLQKNVKCMLVKFCRSITPSPHVGSRVTCVTTASCCYTILGNVFLLNGGSSHQPSAKA